MDQAYDYLIGVDGGGTKTLVRVVRADGSLLGEAVGAGSALRNGAATAWDAILTTLQRAFSNAGVAMPPFRKLAAGMGVAGFNVAQWAEDFRAKAPAFGAPQLASDATTTLLGAHQGKTGAIIAVGTGTIGVALYADGSERVVDGWGFPSGDDASNMPGRAERDVVLDWLSQADQAAFARLARLVIAHADNDPAARNILVQAAAELELMAATLDPQQQLPLALCGGLAAALQAYFSPALQQRITPPLADSADGALLLVRKSLILS